MRNFKMILQYEGTRYKGWQRQESTEHTIQGKLEGILSKMAGTPVVIQGSGRTDAGVHALGQVANFKTNSQIPIEKFAIAINSRLKKSIVIKKAEEVDERFHSRLNCKRKTYRYIINNSPYGTAIYRYLETHIPQKLNVEKMKKAVKYFIGEHDFKAFKASGTSSKSSVRTIYDAKIYQNGDKIYIELTGNGFLYNMVRIIAGTLVEVGLEKIEPEKIEEIIKEGKRENAGKTLPPNGLYLVDVKYE